MTKADLEAPKHNARISRYLQLNAKTPMEKLRNDKLGRVLTDEELNAVKWYVSRILGLEPTGEFARYMVVDGGIEYVLNDFRAHAGDTEWEEGRKHMLDKLHQANDGINAEIARQDRSRRMRLRLMPRNRRG